MAAGVGTGLKTPLFVAAIVVAVLVVAVELGMGLLIGNEPLGQVPDDLIAATDPDLADVASQTDAEVPRGAGIRHLALIDGLLLFVLGLLGSSLVLSHRLYGRLQGAVTLIVSLLWALGAFVLALVALVQLLVMVALFVSVPFGTLAYLAVWGAFPVAESAAVLALLLLLKLVLGGLLIAAQPRFLAVKGLVALFAVSVVLQLVLGLIHQFLPRVVVSIGDQFWALVICIVALVWAIVLLIGAIPAVVRAIRASTAVTDQQ
jgi:hypothetical protein